MFRSVALAIVSLLPAAALAYPGGTPGFQTDAAPFCAGCHSSRSVEVLAGAPGDMATKQLVENKHLAVVEAGSKGYEKLSEADRKTLADHIRALDAATTVTMEAPGSVKAGETFTATVKVTGGSGPVVGVGLVDAAHRWQARPAASAGWAVVGEPSIVGADGAAQTDWLHRRPEASGRNLSYVNVSVASDASKQEWGAATVTFTLRAPASGGTVPLAAVLWYGTEKGTPLGYTEDPIRGKSILGGYTGGSGRVLFSDVASIEVQ